MIKKQYYNRKDRAEWLRLRTILWKKGMFGGSDIATLLDANPWKHAIELFYTTIGFTPPSTMVNEKMIWGTEMEDQIGEMYRYFDLETESLVENYALGLKVNPVRNVNAIVTNDKYPYLFANIDKYLADIDGIGEIKNMVGFVLDAYDKPNEHHLFQNCPIGVPVGYYAQLQQYMLVLEKKRGRFIFNRDGSQMIVHDIWEDADLQEEIVKRSIDFGATVEVGKQIMEKYPDEETRVQYLSAIEPEPDDSDSYNEFRSQQLLQREIDTKAATMIGTDEQFQLGLKYMEANADEAAAKKIKTGYSNSLKAEFFKEGMQKFDFDANGSIGFKKRLSVKVIATDEG